jgi:hypothetical protein
MSLEDVPRCQHVKVNGVQCGSPALRRRRRCYFHHRMLEGRKQFAAESCIKPRPMFSMCLLEDANSVQVALMQVLNLLGSGQMDPKTAGLMLYGLQTASANLRHVKFEAEKATDVVIDRNTVNQTCINGPQWFARDFADQAEDQAEDQAQEEEAEKPAAAASSGPVPAEPAADAEPGADKARPEKVRANKVRANKIRAGNRKWPERAPAEQPPEWMQRILAHFPPAMEASVEAG